MSRDGRAEAATSIVHGSAVAIAGFGVLVLGRSGSGKSGLALRLLALGAGLVADDRVVLSRAGPALVAAAPAPLAGLIEARGVGILAVPAAGPVAVSLAVDLDAGPSARLPQNRTITLLDCDIDLILGRGVPNLEAIIMILAQTRSGVI